jgi:transcriptional regulator with XRE-family HTH domain
MATPRTNHTGPARLRAYFARQTGPRGSRETMARLAARVGVSPQTIWHITRGQPVSPALALKLAHETGIDAAAFPLGRGAFPPALLQHLKGA